MTLKEYQKRALKNLNPTIAGSRKESMRYCCMGLLEETGEVVAELRKPLYKGNFHEKPLNKEAIAGELGDMIWYMALICKNARINIMKLESTELDEGGTENRKKLINNSIQLGRDSGEVLKRYLEFSKGERKRIELEKRLGNQYDRLIKLANSLNTTVEDVLRISLAKSLIKQYRNIVKLSSELNISIEDILRMNLEKLDDRYESKKEYERVDE